MIAHGSDDERPYRTPRSRVAILPQANAEAERKKQGVLRGELLETQKLADQMYTHLHDLFTA